MWRCEVGHTLSLAPTPKSSPHHKGVDWPNREGLTLGNRAERVLCHQEGSLLGVRPRCGFLLLPTLLLSDSHGVALAMSHPQVELSDQMLEARLHAPKILVITRERLTLGNYMQIKWETIH